MKKEKRTYQTPKVIKIKLEIKQAVLGNCFGSSTLAPNQVQGCKYLSGEPCYSPPGIG